MTAPRLIIAVAGLAALTVLGLQTCRSQQSPPAAVGAPSARPSSAATITLQPAATSTPWPQSTGEQSPPVAAGATAADARLQAAVVLRRFCILVDRGRLTRAQALLAPHVWPRRELRPLADFRFISARVHATPQPGTIVLRARIHVRTQAPSPLPDGTATLFFTLGRVGTPTGGWLITAVSSSP